MRKLNTEQAARVLKRSDAVIDAIGALWSALTDAGMKSLQLSLSEDDMEHLCALFDEVHEPGKPHVLCGVAIAPHPPEATPSLTRHYLNVAYKDRDLAKRLGARWCPNARRWYCPAGSPLAKIFSWRKPSAAIRPQPELSK